MNEHQLSLGETTTGGRRELVDRKGQLDYDALMLLTLQRARTAREAIEMIDALCREYGYGSSGETFSIADKNEAWIMELIGKGPGQKGIVWVAAGSPRDDHRPRQPEPDHHLPARRSGELAVFAGRDRVRDREGVLQDRLRQAVQLPRRLSSRPGPRQKRACAGRVWSIYRRSAPSQNFSDAYFRGAEGAEDYPLFIKPDQPLSVHDVMALMRDHYEGTPYDMTKGVDAGPFGSPSGSATWPSRSTARATCGSGRSRPSRRASSS